MSEFVQLQTGYKKSEDKVVLKWINVHSDGKIWAIVHPDGEPDMQSCYGVSLDQLNYT